MSFNKSLNTERKRTLTPLSGGYLHKIPNVHFIFSGSQRHLLTGLFSDAQKPFFSAVEHLQLKSLDHQIYSDFISNHFTLKKQQISESQIKEIINWTRGHTYHTQYFCNRLFAQKIRKIQLTDLELIKREILYSYEQSFLQLKSVLSKNQWKVLVGGCKGGINSQCNQ